LEGVTDGLASLLRLVDAKTSRTARTSTGFAGRARNRPEGERNSTHVVKVLGAGAELLVCGRRDERIAQIAAVQRGRVSRRQLRCSRSATVPD
jgi:hypothetical protein